MTPSRLARIIPLSANRSSLLKMTSPPTETTLTIRAPIEGRRTQHVVLSNCAEPPARSIFADVVHLTLLVAAEGPSTCGEINLQVVADQENVFRKGPNHRHGRVPFSSLYFRVRSLARPYPTVGGSIQQAPTGSLWSRVEGHG